MFKYKYTEQISITLNPNIVSILNSEQIYERLLRQLNLECQKYVQTYLNVFNILYTSIF